ncbi:hemerythrin domain-containing protein [Gilvimarinus sp. DA14]|uniref:hemerythrin domain-containing protein n=1 Tax=Gilvimarinus sp. DA14 TaxID=2956798 RepID=UPI0020B88D19|nr:hemerythrin domain-containing protein [Gilvimarinus sp. DA14]UTF61096.1 hemerythrin domain-containing protein [Gilvimarinus sp. DA14]
MSIYSYLKQDHEKIKQLLNEIDALGPEETPERSELFNRLKATVVVHSKAEEKAFYDPLKTAAKTHDEVEHGEQEHQEAEALLEELTDHQLAGAAWFQKFQTLKEALEHHIEEEEQEVFADAHEVVERAVAEKMEDNMRQEKLYQVAEQSIEKRKYA